MDKKIWEDGILVEHTIDGVPQPIPDQPLISKIKIRKPCIGCGEKRQNLDAKRQVTDSPQA